jgi:rRNA maturation endonuclease Nob1
MIVSIQGVLCIYPEHEIKYVGKIESTPNYHIKCLNTGGEFYSILWKRTGNYLICPCCGNKIEKDKATLIGNTKFKF